MNEFRQKFTTFSNEERALLVTVRVDHFERFDEELAKEELVRLARTAGAHVAGEIHVNRKKPDPALFIGKGKAEELCLLVEDEQINVVVFNNDLSGTQQRNLEEILKVKTIDRTQLILDIFAKHAQSQEGRLQVELAQLEYLLPRLGGKGIMLSRLGGGIGTRGPGEKKLEVDRRRIRDRISKIKSEVNVQTRHRQILGKKRLEEEIPLVALVGYTNAGKSSLLNLFTDAHQIVKDSLFTTLDTINRLYKLKNNQKIILSDTVGFLERLPHGLIEAFKATLEQVRDADILIHVVDISHPHFKERVKAVKEVLEEIGAEKKAVITVLNKIDKLNDRDWLGMTGRDFENPVALSARTGEGRQELEGEIEKLLFFSSIEVELFIPLSKMSLVDQIYRQGEVLEVEYTPKFVRIRARVGRITAESLKQYEHEG